MNILSLFDWMSCGRIALERAWIEIENYYASEIDKHAIQISKKNYPDIIQLWDINNWQEWELPEIDMIIGWSPCQWFSMAWKQLNFEDPRSRLFFTMRDIIIHYRPKYFLLENVKMKKEWQDVITSALFWVQPIEINSSLLSAQNRKRLYWFGKKNNNGWYDTIEVELPDDKGLYIRDILETNVDDKYYMNATQIAWVQRSSYRDRQPYHISQKCGTLKVWWDIKRIFTNAISNSITLRSMEHWEDRTVRYLTPVEYERLQTVSDNYTEKWLQIIKDYTGIRSSLYLSKCKWQNVVLNDVIEEQLGCECAVCIEKDLTNTELQIYQKYNYNLIKNANFVITKYENQGQNECVQNTIKIWKDTETHYILTKLENIIEIKFPKIDTIEVIVEGIDTWYLWKITCEGNWENERLCTILILIRQIIQKKIFTFVNPEVSIHWYIDNLKISQENLLGLELYISKMESITPISNMQRYKMLGNWWTVDVIAHIFSFLL